MKKYYPGIFSGLPENARVFFGLLLVMLLWPGLEKLRAQCNTTEPFSSAVTTGPSQAPGTWYTDRYAPAGFTAPTSAAEPAVGAGRLKQSIAAADGASARPPAYSGTFYNTQGRKLDMATPAGTLKIDLYVDAAWAAANKRMAGLWGTAYDIGNAVSAYPILEYNSDGGNPRFRAYDDGTWIDMGLPAGFSSGWVTLSITLQPNGQFLYEVKSGVHAVAQVTTAAGAYGSVRMDNAILQGYNYDPVTPANGVTYDIYWDDFQAEATAAAVTVAAGSPVCEGGNATFNLSGTPDAILTYNINGGAAATQTLTGGAAVISVTAGSVNQVLHLVSIQNPANSCVHNLTDSATVTVHALPAAPSLNAVQPTCGAGGTITVTAPTGSGYTYSFDNGATYVAGATSGPLSPGSYTVFVKTADGCASATGTTQTLNNPAVAGPVVNTNTNEHFCTIQDAINAPATMNGHTIAVAAGVYNEDVNVHKSVSIIGSGAASTTINGIIGGPGSTIAIGASNVTIAGFTITRNGNNVTDWNNPGLNSAGISIQGLAVSGTIIRDNKLEGNRTGIDINNSNGHVIRNNVIDNNRTGLIFRNQTDNVTFTENEVTNNWTAGILFLDASGGTNSPVQSAVGGNFSNNNISGNWYGQLVERQSGGSLPVPGTNKKNFSSNWLGTTTPVVTTANSAEPGYAAQIPVVYGGTATAPGGQPDICGPASANFDFSPYLNSAADANTETMPGWGTNGFQGTFSTLWVTAAGAQTGTDGRIQEAVNKVTAAGTVQVKPGTYDEEVTVNKPVTINGNNQGIAGNGTRTAESILTGNNAAHSGFVVTAGNVTIDGFTVSACGGTYGAGIYSSPSVSGFTLQNNIIRDNVIGAYPSSNGAATVKHNLFDANNRSGAAGGAGIYVESTNSLTIDGNELKGHTSNSAVIFAASAANAHQNLLFTNNYIHNNNNSNSMLYALGLANATISNNTITEPGTTAIKMAGGNSNVSIANNLLDNSGTAIKVENDAVGANTGIQAHNNSLASTAAISNLDAATVDATCNWFGSTAAATVAGLVTGPVNYNPWLLDGTNNAAAGFQSATACESTPTGVISGTAAICNGDAATLTITATGTGTISGTLSDGTSFSGTSATPITVMVAPAAATTYTIATLQDSNFPALSADLTGSAVITINPAPSLVVTNPASAVSPASVDITAATVTAGSDTGISLSYFTDAAGTMALAGPSAITASGTYYIKATANATGCSSIQPVMVTIAESACGYVNAFGNGLNLGTAPAAGVWYTDRYAPTAFTQSSDFGGSLKQSIAATDGENGRPAAYTSSFYNTQGRKYDLAAGSSIADIKLYVPSAWSSSGRRMAGLWSTAFDASNNVSGYPILEFTSDGGTPRFRAYETGTGAWHDLGLPSGFSYDSWVDLKIQVLPSGEFLYTAGDQMYTTTTGAADASTHLGNVILQGHNTATGVAYDIHWDNMATNIVSLVTDSVVVCAPSNGDLTGTAVTARSVYPAGTTLSYYSDAAATTAVGTPSSVTAGTYYIVASTPAGCADTAAVAVVINPAPSLVVTNPASAVSPASVDITAATVTAGSDTGISLSYFTDAAGTMALAGPSAITASGTYYIKATANATGCSSIQPVMVTIDESACGYVNAFGNGLNLGTAPAAGVWYTDRYAPAAFTQSSDFGGSLKQSIAATDGENGRPAAYTSSFYNTQGRKYDLASGSSVADIKLYVPAAWSSSGRRMAGLWSTAFDASNNVSGYPILEFTSDGGTPRFRAYETGTGAWHDLGLPSGFSYDSWVDLKIQVLPSGEFLYTAGDQMYTTTTGAADASTHLGNVILQGHNTATGVAYDIHWDNMATNVVSLVTDSVIVCAPSNGDLTGTAVTARSVYPAGTTLSYYSDAAATTAVGTPSSVTAGTYYIVASTPAGCADTAAVAVVVQPQATAVISYAGSPFCVTNTNPQAATLTGTLAYTGGVYSAPAGLQIDSLSGSVVPGSSTPGTYTVTYTIPATGACAPIPVTTDVTINALPVATFSYAATPYCPAGTDPSPAMGTGAVAGIFTATPAGLTIDSVSGMIDLSASVPGSYTITNTIAAAGGCAAVTATTPVTISAPPAITSDPASFTRCSGSSVTFTVTATGAGPLNYTWKKDGVPVPGAPNSSSFTIGAVAAANAGAYTVTVSGACSPDATSNQGVLHVYAAPVFNSCPANVTTTTSADGNGNCAATVSYNPIVTSTAYGPTGSSPLAYSYTYAFTGATTGSGSGTGSGASFSTGVTQVAITATNTCGSAICNFTVTVTDDELPVISAPATVNVVADNGVCTASGVALGTPVTSDNCAVASVTSNAPSSFPLGNTNVTWTVTDASGSMATATQQVVVTDNQAPVITAPAALTVNSDMGSCTASGVLLGSASASDNCSVGMVSNNAPAVFPIGNTTVIWTVTDGSGNMDTAAQVVTVVDNQLPVITAPAAVAVNSDISTCTATGVTLGTPVTTDNCTIASVTNNAPTAFPLGNTTVTWTVTDASGNVATATQTVTVSDSQNPTITAPAAVAVSSDNGLCTASGVALGTPVTADNCSVASVTSNAPAAFPLGSTTVTWTVTDGSGHTATATQVVTVTDNQLPSITAPASVSVNADNGVCTASGVALGTPVTADNCSVASVTSNAPATFPSGNTTVTWTVTDGSGNTATATQVVTVVDSQLPVITAPATVTVPADNGVCTASGVALGSPLTSDNCTVASVTNNAPAVFPSGNTTVTWTVTDGSGNIATATQTVTVTDNQLPSITAPAAVSVSSDNGICTASAVALGTPVTSDNCTVASVTNNAPAAFPLGSTTVTWTVTDAAGNTNTANQVVTVTDNQLPVITCPAAVTVNADAGSCNATNVVLGTPVTSDNCSVASVTNDHPSTTFAPGNTTVTWTVTDGSGNTATCMQVVTVSDNQAPQFTSCPAPYTQNVNAAGCSANVATAQPVVGDNCTLSSLTWSLSGATTGSSPATGMNYLNTHNFASGVTNVTYTATDAAGNTQTCTFTVTVSNNLAGYITGTATVLQNVNTTSNITFAATGGTAPYTFTYTVNNGTPQTIATTGANTVTTVPQSNAVLGDYVYTLVSVTDANGCSGALTGDNKDTIKVVANIPAANLAPVVIVPNPSFTSASNTQPFTINIYNLGTVASSGTLSLYVLKPANPGTTITFDPAWTVTESPTYYLIESATAVINGNFGFASIPGTIQLDASVAAGTYSMQVILAPNTGGDNTPSNNSATVGLNKTN